MKLITLLILLTSCGHFKYPIQRSGTIVRSTTNMVKLEKCVMRLIEQNGVAAKDASEVCTHIFRRK